MKQVITKMVFSAAIFAVAAAGRAQKLPGRQLKIIGGYSRHGSGDYNGIIYGAGYTQHIKKKFSLTYNLQTTINNGKDEYIVNNTITGARTDASVRFTVAGLQAGVNAGLIILRTAKHELALSPGIFVRYQSSSNGDDGYELFLPQNTGQPTILIGYNNKTPQKTLAAGALLSLHYDYTVNNKISIGLSPAIQTDTRGDVIWCVSLTAGRRF